MVFEYFKRKVTLITEKSSRVRTTHILKPPAEWSDDTGSCENIVEKWRNPIKTKPACKAKEQDKEKIATTYRASSKSVSFIEPKDHLQPTGTNYASTSVPNTVPRADLDKHSQEQLRKVHNYENETTVSVSVGTHSPSFANALQRIYPSDQERELVARILNSHSSLFDKKTVPSDPLIQPSKSASARTTPSHYKHVNAHSIIKEYKRKSGKQHKITPDLVKTISFLKRATPSQVEEIANKRKRFTNDEKQMRNVYFDTSRHNCNGINLKRRPSKQGTPPKINSSDEAEMKKNTSNFFKNIRLSAKCIPYSEKLTTFLANVFNKKKPKEN